MWSLIKKPLETIIDYVDIQSFKNHKMAIEIWVDKTVAQEEL